MLDLDANNKPLKSSKNSKKNFTKMKKSKN